MVNNKDSIKEKKTDFQFDKEKFKDFLAYTIEENNNSLVVYILTKEGILYKIDLNSKIESRILTLSIWGSIKKNEELALKISPFGYYCAIYNQKGRFGLVIDLDSQEILVHLDRKNYHIEQSNFPIVFYYQDEEHYIIHGIDWNHIEIYNLTKKLQMTKREIDNEKRDIYLDYFYGSLYISPKNKWVISTGWGWHPVGFLHCFSLNEWVMKNIHEPENGKTIRDINPMDDWDKGITWIDQEEQFLGVWGYSLDSFNPIPAFSIWDIEEKKLINWFPGVEPEIVFLEEKVYSWDKREKKISVWDFKTGERIFHKTDFQAQYFHKESKTWITISKEGNLQTLQIYEN